MFIALVHEEDLFRDDAWAATGVIRMLWDWSVSRV